MGIKTLWENPTLAHVSVHNKEAFNSGIHSIINAKYSNISKPIILDKSRGWPAPSTMSIMEDVLGEPPKIVATVRSVADCAASFVRIVKPADIKSFLRVSLLIEHLKNGYSSLEAGYKTAPKNFCFIEYEELLANPQTQLDHIGAFLTLDPFTYDFLNIDANSVKERDDEQWGIPGLHDISPKLGRQHSQDSREILGDLYDSFCLPEFWRK